MSHVIRIARYNETFEELVIYKTLYDSTEFSKNVLRFRLLNTFEEHVVVDKKEIKRFE